MAGFDTDCSVGAPFLAYSMYAFHHAQVFTGYEKTMTHGSLYCLAHRMLRDEVAGYAQTGGSVDIGLAMEQSLVSEAALYILSC